MSITNLAFRQSKIGPTRSANTTFSAVLIGNK